MIWSRLAEFSLFQPAQEGQLCGDGQPQGLRVLIKTTSSMAATLLTIFVPRSGSCNILSASLLTKQFQKNPTQATCMSHETSSFRMSSCFQIWMDLWQGLSRDHCRCPAPYYKGTPPNSWCQASTTLLYRSARHVAAARLEGNCLPAPVAATNADIENYFPTQVPNETSLIHGLCLVVHREE